MEVVQVHVEVDANKIKIFKIINMNFELVGLFAVIALAVSILVIVCQAKKKSSFHSLKTSPSEDKPNIDDITGCTPNGSCNCGVATNDKAYKYNYPPGSFSCGKNYGPRTRLRRLYALVGPSLPRHKLYSCTRSV